MKINTPKSNNIVGGKIELQFTVPKEEEKEPEDSVQEGQDPDEVAALQKQLQNMKNQIEALKQADTETDKSIKYLKNSTVKNREVNFYLNSAAYNNISKEEGFKMLGYFTEKCQKGGYPWKLLKPGGIMKKGKEISIMEAADRMSRGDTVMMQPMRVMNLDLSPTALATVAGAANPVGATVVAMGELTKKTKVSTTPVGHEAHFGAPVKIDNFGELKLLTELYDPEVKPVAGEKVSEAADELGKFVQTVNSNYPWKTMKNESEGKAWRVIKGSIGKGIKWGLIGAGIGVVIAGVGGVIAEKLVSSVSGFGLQGITAAAAAGGGGGLVAGSIIGGKRAMTGEDISAFEALSRVMDGKPILLQKQSMRSFGVPILGSHKYFVPHGKPNIIKGEEDLKLISNIIDQGK